MKEREKRLQKDRNSAQGAVEKYENALEKIEADMKAVKMKTRDIREKFERDAQKEREKIVEEVSRECRVHVEQARKELNEKVERIKKEMEPRNQDLAEKITKRLLN
jgi:F0F1-type ATP synthase membrane subunit b/b'